MVGVYATVPAGIASASAGGASAGVGAGSTTVERVCTAAAVAGMACGGKVKVKGAPRNGEGEIIVVDTALESLIKSNVIRQRKS
jgi:hypothetical protein